MQDNKYIKNETINNIGDKLFNSRIKSILGTTGTSIIFGQKRVGKSTLSSMACQYYNQMGYTCLSNYPIENSFALPMKKEFNKKTGKLCWLLDKDFLYDTDLRGTAIFIDEGANYWPARNYSTDWSARDTEFFTMSDKRNIKLFINVQYIDLLDLNVRRATDTIFFLTRNRYFRNITNVSISELVSLPVANTNALIMSKSIKDAYPISYQLCEIPIADKHFYRTPYYKYFTTEFDFKIYEKTLEGTGLKSWNELAPHLFSLSEVEDEV